MRKYAVVVTDEQVDFVTGSLGTEEAKAITPNIVKFLREMKENDEYDIYCTHDTHHEDYMKTQEGRNLPVPHTIKGTPGWELIPELKEFEDDMINFNKPAFGSTELMTALKEAGYEKIIIIGVCTGICVISNAVLAKAALPETEIVILENLCACVTPETHETALKQMGLLQMKIETYTEGMFR